MAVDDVLRRAGILQDLGRYQEAERLLGQVLAEQPENVDALDTLTRGLSSSGRDEESLVWTRRLLSVYPDHVGGLVRMSIALRALGRAREGLPFARRAVELAPEAPSCLVSLAVTLNRLTNSAEALAVAGRAVAIDPEYAWGHQVIGMIYLDLDQYAEAERATLAALRVDPTNWQLVLQLGTAKAGLGRFDEQREQVQTALRLQATPDVVDMVIELIETRGIPDHFAELYQMTLAARGLPDLSRPGAAGTDPELLARQGRLSGRLCRAENVSGAAQRAAELAEAVLAVDPGNADALHARSSLLLRDGQHEEALRIAERLAAAGGLHRRLLARTREATGDTAGALAAIRLLLAEFPDDANYLRTEAVYLARLGRPDEAVVVIRRSVELMPTAHGFTLESFYLADLGRYDEAVVALRRSIELEPTAGRLAREASYLADLGRYDEALTAIRRSIELEPTGAGLRREALCLLRLGRYHEALVAARRRVELVPSEKGVHSLLALAAKRAGDLSCAEQAYRTAMADDPNDGGVAGELALLLAKADRWADMDAVMAGTPSDITDPGALASYYLRVEAEALRRANRSLKRLSLEAPAPETLAELAHWLGICVRMRETAIARDPAVTSPKIDARLSAIVKILQPVPAGPDSDFALIVCDLAARLDLWRSA